MARPATIRTFEVELSDVDAGAYDSISLRVAQHPSESEAYLVRRIIARALHHGEGADFSKSGLCDGEEAAVQAFDLTGVQTLWVDIGQPSAERLHRAQKKVPKVAVYSGRRAEALAQTLAQAKIHRVEELELYELPDRPVDELAETLARSNAWSIVRSENCLYITAGEISVSFDLRRLPIGLS